MSIAARKHLVSQLFFQADSHRSDLLDRNKTETALIALLLELNAKGHVIEITSVKSDHHDDSALGLHCHFNGYCVDMYPRCSRTTADYLDPNSQDFIDFVGDAAGSVWSHQVGLTPEAYSDRTLAVGDGKIFLDEGAPHVHLGAIDY